MPVLMRQTLIISLACLISTGCTTSSADLYDENSVTLKQLQSQRGSSHGEAGLKDKVSLWSDNQLQAFSRTQANELENIFPQMPNPTIYIYIDPHITQGGLPIPGVTTKTKMMMRDQYALPHEVYKLEQ